MLIVFGGEFWRKFSREKLTKKCLNGRLNPTEKVLC